ncbi:hypothetical protein NQV17_16405 [Burkholderia sp. SCN-KJ]|nr:hypothetical protein [Burkholderia sp. SCN-KJ]MCR4467845.1 hypothetical protein [Burkholderia sp. SCN-KJ]
MPAFAGNLERPVKVDQPVEACWQFDGLQDFQEIDVLLHLFRAGLARRQP